MKPRQCFKCEATDDDKQLRKCPICFGFFCDDCGQSRSGRWFCSIHCADYFFFGEEDD